MLLINSTMAQSSILLVELKAPTFQRPVISECHSGTHIYFDSETAAGKEVFHRSRSRPASVFSLLTDFNSSLLDGPLMEKIFSRIFKKSFWKLRTKTQTWFEKRSSIAEGLTFHLKRPGISPIYTEVSHPALGLSDGHFGRYI
ncbi:unnamed protein product [Eruca vesicaria subsp. sativa]|uniref:Uncharacterized protein n=1 Tax=Eruca vesicaria subsp. sativa TaxID=29727 RepID=A0ABC8LTT2_ERUVS|nr:unnamed protein product [Eruca vesicaria subsp. sativa]